MSPRLIRSGPEEEMRIPPLRYAVHDGI